MSTLTQRNGIWQLNYCLNGKQIRHSLRTHDRTEAEAKAAAILRPARTVARAGPEDGPWPTMVASGSKPRGWLWQMFERTRDRARARGVHFLLTRAELEHMALRSGGRCEVAGIAFDWINSTNSRFAPFAPTIDRIVPADGYHRGNCRLVCQVTNMALADWGEDVFTVFAEAFVAHRRSTAVAHEQAKSAPGVA